MSAVTSMESTMKLFWWGIGITFGYFLILGLTILKFNLTLMASWNEFGDFLAGAFSPVAFLWLVLGFVQQQKELQQNTQALKLQADELKNSVDQYKEMVSIAREQLLTDSSVIVENKKMREIETKPQINIRKLVWKAKDGFEYTYRIHLYSDEREARNVRVVFTNGFGNLKSISREIIKSSLPLPETKIKISEVPSEVELFISFESVIGIKYKHRYRFFDVEDGNYQKVEHLELATA